MAQSSEAQRICLPFRWRKDSEVTDEGAVLGSCYVLCPSDGRSLGDGVQRFGWSDLALGSEIRGLRPARRSFVMHLQRWSTPAGFRPSRVAARREGHVGAAELSSDGAG